MDTSLIVSDRRHLVLPDSCLFAPTELQIGPSLSQNDFSRLGAALASVDQASDLWACDYALAGQKRWGDEGLQLAATATRLSIGYLKVSARIADRFDPARRFPNMKREHYRGLCCFPVDFTDTWLPTVVEKGFGAKTLRALAVEAFGSDPKGGYSKNKKRQVSLPETLYARLKECSPIPKAAVFIEQILSDFVSNATPEQKARIAAALSTRDADKVRARRKAEKPEKIKEPADVKFQLKKFQKAHRDAYADILEQVDGAKPMPTKPRRVPVKEKIVIQMTETCYSRNIKIKDAVAAQAAAEQYSAEHGYRVEAGWCDACKAFHIQSRDFGPGTLRPEEVVTETAHIG